MSWTKPSKAKPEASGYYLIAVSTKPDVIWYNAKLEMWVGPYGFEMQHIKYWQEIEPVPEDVEENK